MGMGAGQPMDYPCSALGKGVRKRHDVGRTVGTAVGGGRALGLIRDYGLEEIGTAFVTNLCLELFADCRPLL